MRLTVIGHACLHVATDSGSLIVDPWLVGSVGWRSWWHYPPIGDLDPAWLEPDFVYLTHHHPDHFHYPTLRKIDRHASIFVGKFGVDVMRPELRKLGFDRVQELAHGERVQLSPDLEIASYQYGFDDTALVIRSGDVVIADVNDCKIRGRATDQIVDDWGRPTFMLKAFSWAQGYPYCYTADDPADLALVTRESTMQDFVEAARHLRPRFAIPFASLVAFLHPDTRDLNRHSVTPAELVGYVEQVGGLGDTELVPLDPGSSWTPGGGFEPREGDWWTDREARLEEEVTRIQPALDRQAEIEAARTLDFRTFADYFEAFARAVPLPVRKAALGRPVAFEVPSGVDERGGRPFWTIDFLARRVLALHAPPDDAACIIRIPEGVLADALDNRITHFAQGSMRIRTHLRPGGTPVDLAFWGLIMVWEIGYLPIRNDLSLRFVDALWRRRREAYDSFAALTIRGEGGLLERMAGNFSPSAAD
ncbi:MAG: MBL fold metallo-hydrolase [Acidimicrobiia bacterium]